MPEPILTTQGREDLDEELHTSSSAKQLGYAAAWDGYSRLSNPHTFSDQNADFLKGCDWDSGFKLAQHEMASDFSMDFRITAPDLIAEFNLDGTTDSHSRLTTTSPNIAHMRGWKWNRLLKMAKHHAWILWRAKTGHEYKPDY